MTLDPRDDDGMVVNEYWEHEKEELIGAVHEWRERCRNLETQLEQRDSHFVRLSNVVTEMQKRLTETQEAATRLADCVLDKCNDYLDEPYLEMTAERLKNILRGM